MDDLKNKKNSMNLLIKIRSEYIFKKIFINLKDKNLLQLIRYSNKLKRKLNKDIDDYMKEFFKVEIEIIPKRHKYGKFVNIYYNEKYYHIYFDNNKEEIKRKEIFKKEKVSKIKVVIDYDIKTFNKLFQGCQTIKKINFIRFNRETVENMSYWFQGCSELEEINFTCFNINNVKNLSHMFEWCESLKILNNFKINTENVTNMSYMFNGCKSIDKLNLFSLNTKNVINMGYMFKECKCLNKLDISNFNTDNEII